MLNRYFGFSCSPFENTLDQRFLFRSRSHEEVIETLLYFTREKKSFAMVCGDVGTGKTMILHHLLEKLPESVLPILVPYPDVEYVELLRYMARVLKKNPEGKGILDLTTDVKEALTGTDLEGRQVVLIIDEAHLLSTSSLENIRLLSNMEITEKKLLQILLIGQNELGIKLRQEDMRQLRQRININCTLSPMSPSETIEYIDHRLKVAGACSSETSGSCFDGCFAPECKKPLYEMTGGVPRSINQLCDIALLICMTEQREFRVTRRILEKAHSAIISGSVKTTRPRPAVQFSRAISYAKVLKPALATAAVLALVLALGVLGFKYDLGERLRLLVSGPDIQMDVNKQVEKRPLLASKGPGRGNSAVVAEENSAPEITRESQNGSALPETKSADAGSDAGEVEKIEDDTVSPVEKEAGAESAALGATEAEHETTNENRNEHKRSFNQASVARVSPDDAIPDTPPEERASGPSDFLIVVVHRGDSLSKIAARLFPQDPESGKRLILSANPGILNQNRILVGQTLRVPRKSAETGADSGK